MRFFTTVLLAALTLFVIYLIVAAILSYFDVQAVPGAAVPDSWSPPDSWSEWRDIVIVLSGFWWFLAGIMLFALFTALLIIAIIIRRILLQNVIPAIDSMKASLDRVQGTAEFTGETVVSPIIRVYSVFSGVRSGVGAIGGLPGRIRGRRGKK